MFDFEGQLNRLVSQQRTEADQTVTSASSYAIYEAFSKAFYKINGSTVSSSTSGEQISIDFANFTLLIDRWINELTYFVDDIRLQLQMFDPIPYEVIDQTNNLRSTVESHIIPTYEELKTQLAEIETDFSSVAISYKSLVERSVNAMLMFHNTHNDIEGDFSRFKNISVYVDGSEATGDGFFKNLPESALAGDVVVHEKREGSMDYYIVTQGENGLELSSQSEQTMKQTPEFQGAEGRVHLVYETEVHNEHRQKTNNHIEETLIHLGLMQGDKNIHMHADRYGGHRSWQLALDYPASVEAITTIATPYAANPSQKDANITETDLRNIGKHDPDSFANASSSRPKLHADGYGEMVNNRLDTMGTEIRNAHPDVSNDLSKGYVTDGSAREENSPETEPSGNIEEQRMIHIGTVSPSHPPEMKQDNFKSLLKGIHDTDLN